MDFKELRRSAPDDRRVANEDVEAATFSTSLDPYGQLVRVLMPRASQVAIYDRLSTPLWLSDGQDGADLLRLVEESLNSVRYGSSGSDQESRHGFSRSWDGDTAYIFLLREGATLLGALAVSCQDGSSGARSFGFVHGLLRPVLQVLARELAHQYNLGDLQKNLTSRDGDLDLLLDASGSEQDDTGDDLEQFALEVISSSAPALTRLDAHFAINISGQSIGDEEFTQFLEQRLRDYSLPPQLLSFEITETAAVANIVQAEIMIRRLQDLGHAIALDDFGRGLSSLTYLKSLPVTYLKIDGGLVRDLVGNQRSQAMVTAIVQLARAMNLQTTAECVENEAILAAVGQLGVDFAQGFAIGRPRPFELVLQELLRASAGVIRQPGTQRLSRAVGAG